MLTAPPSLSPGSHITGLVPSDGQRGPTPTPLASWKVCWDHTVAGGTQPGPGHRLHHRPCGTAHCRSGPSEPSTGPLGSTAAHPARFSAARSQPQGPDGLCWSLEPCSKYSAPSWCRPSAPRHPPLPGAVARRQGVQDGGRGSAQKTLGRGPELRPYFSHQHGCTDACRLSAPAAVTSGILCLTHYFSQEDPSQLSDPPPAPGYRFVPVAVNSAHSRGSQA